MLHATLAAVSFMVCIIVTETNTPPPPSPPHLFSVWAPQATTVEVVPVAAVPGGRQHPAPVWRSVHLNGSAGRSWWWSGAVAGVVAGDGYVFRIDGNDSLRTIDPRATDVALDSSCSVVSIVS